MRAITKYDTVKFFCYLGLFSAWISYLVTLHGTFDGVLLAFLTWSFFVLCTPIILEGFLVSFVHGLFRGGQLYDVSIFAWVISVLLNFFTYNFYADVYQKTLITNFLHIVISRPFPERFILILCALGTFYAWLCHIRGTGHKVIHKAMGWILSGIGFALFLYFYYRDVVLFCDLYF